MELVVYGASGLCTNCNTALIIDEYCTCSHQHRLDPVTVSPLMLFMTRCG